MFRKEKTENICDIRLGQDFLKQYIKNINSKEKNNDQLDFIKIKYCCCLNS